MNAIVQARRRRGPFGTPLAAMALAALLALAATAHAQDPTTRQWLALCETDLKVCQQTVAIGDLMLRAVYGGLPGQPATIYCSIVPNLSDESTALAEDEDEERERAIIAIAAATKAVRWWLADRPNLADEDASRSMLEALLAIYPCPQ